MTRGRHTGQDGHMDDTWLTRVQWAYRYLVIFARGRVGHVIPTDPLRVAVHHHREGVVFSAHNLDVPDHCRVQLFALLDVGADIDPISHPEGLVHWPDPVFFGPHVSQLGGCRGLPYLMDQVTLVGPVVFAGCPWGLSDVLGVKRGRHPVEGQVANPLWHDELQRGHRGPISCGGALSFIRGSLAADAVDLASNVRWSALDRFFGRSRRLLLHLRLCDTRTAREVATGA